MKSTYRTNPVDRPACKTIQYTIRLLMFIYFLFVYMNWIQTYAET